MYTTILKDQYKIKNEVVCLCNPYNFPHNIIKVIWTRLWKKLYELQRTIATD
jgi:hypothetical protein